MLVLIVIAVCNVVVADTMWTNYARNIIAKMDRV